MRTKTLLTMLYEIISTLTFYSGLVGQSWAIVFSTARFRVRIYDCLPEKLTEGIAEIQKKMKDLELRGCLRGDLSAEEAFKYIKGTPTIEQCVTGACYVQVWIKSISFI